MPFSTSGLADRFTRTQSTANRSAPVRRPPNGSTTLPWALSPQQPLEASQPVPAIGGAMTRGSSVLVVTDPPNWVAWSG
jgi:hypothetical protein